MGRGAVTRRQGVLRDQCDGRLLGSPSYLHYRAGLLRERWYRISTVEEALVLDGLRESGQRHDFNEQQRLGYVCRATVDNAAMGVRRKMKPRFEFGLWIYGLISAFVGGGATALSGGTAVALIDPGKFNIQHPQPLFLAMASMFVASGLPSFFAYLRQHPLPQVVTIQTTVGGTTTTTTGGTTTTVQLPAEPKKD
jgi:hypothetical protein